MPGVRDGLAVYGRTGQRCHRCAGTIEARGGPVRTLYWCPGCQVRLDPRLTRDDSTPTDRHPAAVKFLDDPPWRRTG